MPAEQVRPRQGAVLFQRDAGRAGPQQKRDPNTGPRSATYTHVPTPCKVAQPMDRAQHCQPPFVSLRSVHYWWSRQGLHQSPAPRPARTRDSTPQRKEPVDTSNDGLTRLPGGRVDRPHARAGCCCCNRGLKRCWPIWPLPPSLGWGAALRGSMRACTATAGRVRHMQARARGRQGRGRSAGAGAGVRARPPVRHVPGAVDRCARSTTLSHHAMMQIARALASSSSRACCTPMTSVSCDVRSQDMGRGANKPCISVGSN
jgi:hypothetical protein